MKETAEALDRELNILKAENERLSNITGQMESSVKNLNDMEKTLEHLRESETQNLDVLEEQLRESQAILESMEVRTNKQTHIIIMLKTTILEKKKQLSLCSTLNIGDTYIHTYE